MSSTSSYGSIDLNSDQGSSSSDKKRTKIWTMSHTTERPKMSSPSVGVAYDINNQPMSVNTFGSVNPDVTSEVDLNTTSETDVEDKKQYEPNILERALERTICYHPRRKSKASKLTIGLLCILTLGFHAAILVVSPIYVSSIRKAGGDESVVLLTLAAAMPPVVVLLSLLLRHAYDKTITLRPTAPKLVYLGLGFFLALRLNVGVFSSHPDRTPWSLQPILATSLVPFSFFVSVVGLGKKVSCRRLFCALIVLASVFICAEPRIWSLEGSDEEELFRSNDLFKQVLWPSVYALSFLPLAIYHALAEHELRKNSVHSFSLSTSGLLMGSVFTVLMASADFIPFYGRVDTFPEMWEVIKDGEKCNFGYIPDGQHCLFKLIVFAGSVIGLNIFSFLLISASEGTMFLSLVSSLAAPLAAGFWTVFRYDYAEDEISWQPEWSHTSMFVIASVVMGVPAVIAYSVFAVKDVKKAKREQKGYSDVSSSEYDWE